MYKYIFLIYLVIQYVYGQEVPIVSTTHGLVRGLAAENGDYNMYLGIPYGVVDPQNPFGPSSPHPEYIGTFDAIDDSAVCPQTEEFNGTLVGTLDCLHLNVFVPRSTTEPKPVLVWIFGGRFELGFYGRFLYGPKFLVRHDIILVTVNYRLGPYGFMCTENPRVPGNQGLKDQLMALRWVRENIANFGGDPNRVTIDGNSAGSMSVDFQIVRNHEPRLFSQAILQSGTSLAPSFAFPDTNAPQKLARHFGLETDDVPVALDFLASIDPLAIVEASKVLEFAFRPCIEETFEGVEAFVNYNWVRNDTVPLAKDINVLIGFNDDEGLGGFLAFNRSLTNSVNESLSSTFDIDHEEFEDSDIVRQFFFGDEELNYDMLQGAVDLQSDTSFIYPSIRSVERFLNNDVQKVYLYMFTYSGGRNFAKTRNNITQGGAVHGDELGYLFDIEYMEEPAVDDQLILDRMTTMWTNFVKYGDPTPQISTLLPLKWEPITPSDYHYMNINLDLSMSKRPLHERMTFWDIFFEKNGHLQLFMLKDGRRKNVHKRPLDEVFPY